MTTVSLQDQRRVTPSNPFAGRQDGSLAESTFERINPRAVRFGFDHPHDAYGDPISIAPLPRHMRETPDFILPDLPALVECQGVGFKPLALKVAKVASLNAWRLFSDLPTYLFVYDSHRDEVGYLPVELLPDLVTVQAVTERFGNGDEYVRVPKADLPCEFVPVHAARPLR
jgi:hypothetical protein